MVEGLEHAGIFLALEIIEHFLLPFYLLYLLYEIKTIN